MRVRMLAAVAVLAIIVGAGSVRAASVIGSWVVTNQEDRFGDGGRFVAMTPAVGAPGAVFAVRCFARKWSLAMIPGTKLVTGEAFKLRLRVDKGGIVDGFGQALDEQLLQIAVEADAEPRLIKEILAGREIAVRLTNVLDVSSDLVFRLTGSRKALAGHLKECKL